MKTRTMLVLLAGCLALAQPAVADVLEQKVADAKAAHEKAKELAASAAQRLKAAKDALEKKEEELKKRVEVPELKAQQPFVPWCDTRCLAALDGLIDPNRKPALDKLAPMKAAAQALEEAAISAMQKSLGEVAELQSALDQADPKLAPEAKALFVAACYSGSINAETCSKRVVEMAKYARTVPAPAAPALLATLGAIPDVPLDDRVIAHCGMDCREQYAGLRSPDNELNPDKLPNEDVCQAVLEAVKGVPDTKAEELLKLMTTLRESELAQQKALLLAVCAGKKYAECVANLQFIVDYKTSDRALRAERDKAQAVSDTAKSLETSTLADYTKAKREAAEASDTPVPRLSDRLALVRRARCATAYCWGGNDGRRNAIEPILDLPIGMYWAVGSGALPRYINANNIKIQATAGLRYWFAYDVMSVGILLAQPNLTEMQSSVDFRGRALGTSQVRRTYPTVVVGLWGDILQLSFSVDELRNGSAGSPNHLPEFAPNQVLSRAITLGVAINPITAARNGIGAANSSQEAAK